MLSGWPIKIWFKSQMSCLALPFSSNEYKIQDIHEHYCLNCRLEVSALEMILNSPRTKVMNGQSVRKYSSIPILCFSSNITFIEDFHRWSFSMLFGFQPMSSWSAGSVNSIFRIALVKPLLVLYQFYPNCIRLSLAYRWSLLFQWQFCEMRHRPDLANI